MLVTLAILLSLLSFALALLWWIEVKKRRQLQSSLVHSPSDSAWEFLKLSQQVARVGSWNWDIADNTIQWSDEMCRLHGHDPLTFKPTMETALECYTPEDRERISLGIQKSLQQGWSEPGEYRITLPDGSVRVVWVHWKTFFDDSGVPIRMIGANLDITERSCTEEEIRRLNSDLEQRIEERTYALSEALNLNKLILASASHGIAAYDWDGKCIFANSAMSSITGLSTQQIQTHKLDDPSLWRDRKLSDTAFQVLRSGEPSRIDTNFTSAAGGTQWLECTLSRFNRSGAPHLLVIFNDITERKQAEQGLRESEERLQRALEGSAQALWDFNVAKGCVYLSEHWSELLEGGKKPMSISIESYLESVHPDDRELLNNNLRKLNRRQVTDFRVEYRVHTTKDNWKWVNSRGKVVARNSDYRVTHMVGTSIDITERKQFEQTLREREQMLSTVQRVANLGSYVINTVTGKTDWSDEFYLIHGYQPRAVIPDFVEHILPLIHEEDRSRARDMFEQLTLSGKAGAVEYRIKSANGSERILFTEGQLIGSTRDGSLSVLGTVQDITMFKQAAADAIRAREEAERASRAKSEFLSSMSHELRTPLNAVLGFAQLIEVEESANTTQKENASQIVHAGKHLLQLINDILDLTRIETGGINLIFQAVPVATPVNDVVNLTRAMAEEKQVTLHTRIDEGAMVYADSTRLRQALLNLVSNAIKYNCEGGTVTISTSEINDKIWRMVIRDTGRGISPDRSHQLFESFNRLGAEKSNIEGMGIGLVITRRLVELMGGTIGFESVQNEGSVFWIELPAAQDSDELILDIPNVPVRSIGSSKPEVAAITALYLEDNTASRKLMQRMLNKYGNIQLMCAATPSVGLQLAQTHRPDIIFLDINLPEMDGYEVLTHLRRFSWARRTPIVAVTSNAMAADITRGEKAGFCAYLTKPVDLHVLHSVIKRFFPDVDQDPTAEFLVGERVKRVDNYTSLLDGHK